MQHARRGSVTDFSNTLVRFWIGVLSRHFCDWHPGNIRLAEISQTNAVNLVTSAGES